MRVGTKSVLYGAHVLTVERRYLENRMWHIRRAVSELRDLLTPIDPESDRE